MTFAESVVGKVLEVRSYAGNEETTSRYRITAATSKAVRVVDSNGKSWQESRGTGRILPASAKLFENKRVEGITVTKNGAPVGFIPPDRRAVTSPENGKKGGRPRLTDEPLVTLAVKVTPEQKEWADQKGADAIRAVIQREMEASR